MIELSLDPNRINSITESSILQAYKILSNVEKQIQLKQSKKFEAEAKRR